MTENVYQENGFENRKAYLASLAEEYGIFYSEVKMIADVLGENEDFDGLVTSLEDYLESEEMEDYNYE